MAIALAAAAALAPGLSAQDQGGAVLRAEFWIDLYPVSAVGDPWPVDLDEGARRLLEEATWVFGGMVWGFEYRYEPYDKARGIAERFDLKPLGAVAAGDPRLAPEKARGNSGELRAYVEYRLSAAESALLDSYSREPWVRSQGAGRAELIRGWPGRREACEEALREAVRAHLRSIEPNKPRRSTGRVVFEKPPRLAIRDGAYLAQARARVEVLELLPYVVY